MLGLRVMGGEREVALGEDVVRCREIGSGQTLVFIPGIPPLGGPAGPMGPGTDLSPRGVARIVADFMEALDLRDVTLVGNDTGGAVCRIVVAEHPGRIGHPVLTNRDAYEAFSPGQLSIFHYGPRVFGTRFVDALAWALRARPVRRLLPKLVAKRRMDEATLDAYFTNPTSNAGVRRDLTRFLQNVSEKWTLAAAGRFPDFRRPVLIVRGENDPFFLTRYARRLSEDSSHARLKFLPGSRAFVPEDRPEALVELVSGFVDRPATVAG